MGFFNNPDPFGTLGIWSSSTVGEGPNLRAEFNKLVLGDVGYRGIGQFLLLRKMSRTKQHCPCWNITRGSASDCKFCKGEGYVFEEVYVRGHFTQTFGRSITVARKANKLMPEGYFDLDKAMIYLPFDTAPETGDSVFRIRVNQDGKPYYPVERIEKWRVDNVEDRRQEAGEIAFFILVCERVEF